MTNSQTLRLAIGGMLAMAAALGIGRFVYTPILPVMMDALGWSKVDAGLVASANFLGYLIGALVAGRGVFAANPRRWLQIALVVSVMTTLGMALTDEMLVLSGLRFVGGVASAFVIICASTLVLEQLAVAGRGQLAGVHFAGVGVGIIVSAAVVAALAQSGAGWRSMWVVSGLVASLTALVAMAFVKLAPASVSVAAKAQTAVATPGVASMVIAYGLFGFGYVITATFLVAIVRQTPEIRPLEPWIWMLFGFAAVPSVPMWQRLGLRMGLTKAFAVACLIEAAGVAASVEWVGVAGVCLAAVLLGGTFMGLTALGLMSGRALSGGRPQRIIGMMSASFAAGQMIGPGVAGVLSERTGDFRAASLVAAAALLCAAVLAFVVSPHTAANGR